MGLMCVDVLLLCFRKFVFFICTSLISRSSYVVLFLEL